MAFRTAVFPALVRHYFPVLHFPSLPLFKNIQCAPLAPKYNMCLALLRLRVICKTRYVQRQVRPSGRPSVRILTCVFYAVMEKQRGKTVLSCLPPFWFFSQQNVMKFSWDHPPQRDVEYSRHEKVPTFHQYVETIEDTEFVTMKHRNNGKS